jgi:predicted MPP superfamily phosphohydrolase
MRTVHLVTAVAVVAGLVGTGQIALVASRARPAGPDRPARLRGRALVAGVAVAAAVGVVGLVAVIEGFQGGQVRIDLVVHQVYLGLAITLPLLGLGTLVLSRRLDSSRALRVVAVLLLVPGVLGLYATHVEPLWLRVDHHDVPVAAARRGDDPVRIAVLADLQTTRVGEHEREAIDAVLAARPDVVLLPGDLFQGRSVELDAALPELRRQLGRLSAPGGVYFVRGDVDQGRRDRTHEIIDGLDITVLEDEAAETEVGDRLLRIGGTRLDVGDEGADRVRDDLVAEPDDGAITILLSHRPDTVLALPSGSRVDLTVAGHTHGGQVVLPVLGALVRNTDIPRSAARGGLHRVDGNALYVGPGVGMARGLAPQVRFLSRPAIGILTLADG